MYLDTNESCLSTHFCFCRVFYVLSVYGYSKYCLLKYCLFVSGLLRLLVILLCKSCSPAPSKTKLNCRSEKNSPCPDVVFDYEIFVCILQYVLICHYLPAYNVNETFLYLLSVAKLVPSCRQLCLYFCKNSPRFVVSNYENFQWSHNCSINIHSFFKTNTLCNNLYYIWNKH